MTPREFQALYREWKNRREFECAQFADLQATIHNGLWKRDDGKVWTRAMFMPGYVPPPIQDDWRTQKAVFAAMAAKRNPPSPEERKQRKQAVRDRAERSKRALEAAARGVTGEQIQQIMLGKA